MKHFDDPQDFMNERMYKKQLLVIKNQAQTLCFKSIKE